MNTENTAVHISLFDWEQHKAEIALLHECIAKQQGKQLSPVDLHALLSEKPDDLAVYEIESGDKETRADISLADWKMARLAINVLSRRVHSLVRDLDRIEKRIETLDLP